MQGSTAATLILTLSGVVSLVLVNLRALFGEAAGTLDAWRSLRRAWRETDERKD